MDEKTSSNRPEGAAQHAPTPTLGAKNEEAKNKFTPTPRLASTASPEAAPRLHKNAKSDVSRVDGTDPDARARGRLDQMEGAELDSGGPTASQVGLQNKLRRLDPEVAQLDWFVFETRIRSVIHDLLDAPVESVKVVKEKQDELQAALDQARRRIDEHDFLLFKFQKRTEMEAEYEQRITRMETAVNTQLTKTQASMTALDVKVEAAERKSAGTQESLERLNDRLDMYLQKLKEDLDKMAARNLKLFTQFTDAAKQVDQKYEQFHLQMEAHSSFFQENKERYQDCIDKMEGILTQQQIQDRYVDDHVKRLRAELDRLDERINEKDSQSSDTLYQVVENSHKIGTLFAKLQKIQGRVTAERRYQLVVSPFKVTDQIFEVLFKATHGSQFNRILDFRPEFYKKLEQQYDAYTNGEEDSANDEERGEDSEWLPLGFSIPTAPPRQPEDKIQRREGSLMSEHPRGRANRNAGNKDSKGYSKDFAKAGRDSAGSGSLQKKQTIVDAHAKASSGAGLPPRKAHGGQAPAPAGRQSKRTATSGAARETSDDYGASTIKPEQDHSLNNTVVFNAGAHAEQPAAVSQDQELGGAAGAAQKEHSQANATAAHAGSGANKQEYLHGPSQLAQAHLSGEDPAQVGTQESISATNVGKGSEQPNGAPLSPSQQQVQAAKASHQPGYSAQPPVDNTVAQDTSGANELPKVEAKDPLPLAKNAGIDERHFAKSTVYHDISERYEEGDDRYRRNEGQDETAPKKVESAEEVGSSSAYTGSQLMRTQAANSQLGTQQIRDTRNLVDEERVRALLGELREAWQEADDAKYAAMCQETCLELLEEHLEPALSRLHEAEALIQEQLGAESENQARLQALEQECKESCAEAAQTVDDGQQEAKRKFQQLREQLVDKLAEQATGLELTHHKFTLQMQEAFENFKISTELEQTKRLRQIGDFMATQKRLLGQINFNEKNYQIFQKTSEQLCEQMKNIVDLLGLQNSLNFQEEKDKESVALYGGQEIDKALAEPGSELEQSLKPFMKGYQTPAAQQRQKQGEAPNALQFKADLLGGGHDKQDSLGTMAHLDLDRRCQVCQQESTSRHVTVKAMRFACLKYRSGQVRHFNKLYKRMDLIKIQEELVEQHSKQIQAIMASKVAMEQAKDAHGKAADVPQYSIRLQDLGVAKDSTFGKSSSRYAPEDDGLGGHTRALLGSMSGLHLQGEESSPSYLEGRLDSSTGQNKRLRATALLPQGRQARKAVGSDGRHPAESTEQRLSRNAGQGDPTTQKSTELLSARNIQIKGSQPSGSKKPVISKVGTTKKSNNNNQISHKKASLHPALLDEGGHRSIYVQEYFQDQQSISKPSTSKPVETEQDQEETAEDVSGRRKNVSFSESAGGGTKLRQQEAGKGESARSKRSQHQISTQRREEALEASNAYRNAPDAMIDPELPGSFSTSSPRAGLPDEAVGHQSLVPRRDLESQQKEQFRRLKNDILTALNTEDGGGFDRLRQEHTDLQLIRQIAAEEQDKKLRDRAESSDSPGKVQVDIKTFKMPNIDKLMRLDAKHEYGKREHGKDKGDGREADAAGPAEQIRGSNGRLFGAQPSKIDGQQMHFDSGTGTGRASLLASLEPGEQQPSTASMFKSKDQSATGAYAKAAQNKRDLVEPQIRIQTKKAAPSTSAIDGKGGNVRNYGSAVAGVGFARPSTNNEARRAGAKTSMNFNMNLNLTGHTLKATQNAPTSNARHLKSNADDHSLHNQSLKSQPRNIITDKEVPTSIRPSTSLVTVKLQQQVHFASQMIAPQRTKLAANPRTVNKPGEALHQSYNAGLSHDQNMNRDHSASQHAFGDAARTIETFKPSTAGSQYGHRHRQAGNVGNVYEDYNMGGDGARRPAGAHSGFIQSMGHANPAARSSTSLHGPRRAVAPHSAKKVGAYAAARASSALSSQHDNDHSLLGSYSNTFYDYKQQRQSQPHTYTEQQLRAKRRQEGAADEAAVDGPPRRFGETKSSVKSASRVDEIRLQKQRPSTTLGSCATNPNSSLVVSQHERGMPRGAPQQSLAPVSITGQGLARNAAARSQLFR